MSEFYQGLAEIVEVDTSAINPAFDLHSGEAAWDSLAVVSTMALIDEVFNVMVDGQSLGKCATVADIEALIEAAKKA
ncbi:acyl carrier protein [Roseateles asaccharophilus]|uniref:Acyl carrier protein n=1 Tax=Roseateles asaccharophilus TaxID=582607 RepID=A0ABU2ABW8_9BURK|nr:acyl carrier protein [Roseateles asaccharophilus]MDR7334702.1 acyl carrier protein [Roseateles asaccharophilus]